MYADYEADMSYYDYYEACPMCAERSVFKGSSRYGAEDIDGD